MCQASKSVKAEEEKMPEAKDMATFLEGAWNVRVVDAATLHLPTSPHISLHLPR